MRESQRIAYKRYSQSLAGQLARAKANLEYWKKEYARLQAESEAEKAELAAE